MSSNSSNKNPVSFQNIAQEKLIFWEKLPADKIYYAHTSSGKKKETLKEHTDLVTKYTLKILDKFCLETPIDQFSKEFCSVFQIKDTLLGQRFFKQLFLNAIIYHDLGKINENFQYHKMENSAFSENPKNAIGTKHSILSAYLYVVHHIAEVKKHFTGLERQRFFYLVFLFACSIKKHHSSYLSFQKALRYKPEIKKLDSYLVFLGIEEEDKKDALHQFDRCETIEIFFYKDDIKKENLSFLFILLKLHFSILTAADFYATSEYMQNLKIEDFGLFKKADTTKLHRQFWDYKHNQKLHKNFHFYENLTSQELFTHSQDNLNLLRQKMLAEVIANIRQHPEENIFYLEAPTGAGKTNISLAIALELMLKNENLNKIFYVFPYTAIATQTFKKIKDTLGIGNETIIELHSRAGFHNKIEEEKNDGFYGDERYNYLDNLFLNYPLVLLTHVRFFEILSGNSKESNYLMHRLANSIVIIDELQSYPPHIWDKICYFICQYSRYLNMKFLFMSATLPKLGDINPSLTKGTVFFPLVKEKSDYFQNPNFKNRVQFDFSFLDKQIDSVEKLAPQVKAICEQYYSQKGHIKCLVQFITKRSARVFRHNIEQSKLFQGYDIYLLSGDILEHKRQEIIDIIKDTSDESHKILLISTQVIEAGVDIDMDIGFKNKALIDNEEQVAGRINRENSKINSVLYIFEIDEAKTVYRDDLRCKVMTSEEISEEYKNILQNKDFDKLYQLVYEKINRKNKDPLIENLSSYQKNMASLDLEKVKEGLKIIKQTTYSIFVPLKIPEETFSNTEKEFLQSQKAYQGENKIDGEKVWKLYQSFIKAKDLELIQKKAGIKKIYGIISKYIFSVHSKQKDDLLHYTDPENSFAGILYLSHHEKIYSEEEGLKPEDFQDGYCL